MKNKVNIKDFMLRVRMSQDFKTKLQELSQRHNLSMSEYLRQFVEKEYTKMDRKDILDFGRAMGEI
jgi:hypothetical protein